MKRIVLFAVLALIPSPAIFGQTVQTSGWAASNTVPNTNVITQAGYNVNTPLAPVMQVQYQAPSPQETLVEPVALPPHPANRSNQVIPLPKETPQIAIPQNPAQNSIQSSSPQSLRSEQYSQPVANPNLIFASHSQGETPQVQFNVPVISDVPVVRSIPTAVEQQQMAQTPQILQTNTAQLDPAPLPASVPAAPVPAIPARLVASEAITKNHRLQSLRSDMFEQKLTDKLGKRFVTVRNVESSDNLSRFRLPVKDGTDVELSVDRQNGIITLVGSAPMVESCLQIVRLLDSPDNAEFLPVQRSNRAAFQQTAQIVNQVTQSPAAQSPRLAQNPMFQRSTDQPSANFVTPNTAPNGQNAAQAGADSGGSVVGPVQIDIIDGLDMMVIRATAKDAAAIREMLQQIESMSLEHEPIIELVPMKNADSYRVSQMVQQLYSQVYAARKGGMTMLPLIKPNTILMIGKQESINTAKELVAKLDTPVAPESEFQIFRLKNASSDALQTQITQFYSTNRIGSGQGLEPQVNIVSDTRTNALIVQANPRDMLEIANMVLQLDAEGSDATNIVKTFPLKNAMASELATTLQNAITGTTSTTGGGGFGGGANSQNSRTRNPMVSMGTIDKDGNLQRASVLYDVRVVADTRSNTLIVTAPPDSMPLIEALIKQLDQLPSAETQIKVFTLVNGDAYTLTTVLTQLFAQSSTTGGGLGGGTQSTSQIASVRPGIEEGESTLVSVRFQTDTRTNSIIACGSAGDMTVVEALLMRLDEENMNNRKVMILKPINSIASEIATAINNYATSERQLEIQNSNMYLPQSPREQYRKEIVVVADDATNTLIVSTTPRYYDQIRKMVQELDERSLMVAIQVLIAEVRMTHNNERGIELGLQDSLLFDRSLLSNGALSPGFLFGSPSQGLPLGNVKAGTVGTQGITSLGTGRTGESGIGGFTFSASSESVSVLVRALEEQGKLRILSRPFLTTLHNTRATIKVGQDVPYVAGSDSSYGGNTSSQVEYREVGTILDIIPRVTADNQIFLAVYVEKSSVGSIADGIPVMVSNGVALNAPKFNATNAQTYCSAMDGQTIVFAGLITETKESVNRSIPGLNKIPVVKHLFEYNATKCERSELLIVLTPTIIRSEMDLQVLRQQEASRMHWCVNDVVKLTGNSKMKIRGDEWYPTEVEYTPAAPVILDEKQLPSDEKVKKALPFPALAPAPEHQ